MMMTTRNALLNIRSSYNQIKENQINQALEIPIQTTVKKEEQEDFCFVVGFRFLS